MTRETVKSGNIKEMKPGVIKIDGHKNGRMRDKENRKKGGGGVLVEYNNVVFFCCSGRPIEMGRKTWGQTIFYALTAWWWRAITRTRSLLKCLTSCAEINASPASRINTPYTRITTHPPAIPAQIT